MVAIKEIADIKIGIIEIPSGAPLKRRQREREAVQEILKALFPYPMELCHNADGAPIIANIPISITHSQRLAIVAVNLKSSQPIGIDAEEYRSALERVKTRFLNPKELEWIVDKEDLLRAWTVKEAVYKAAGIRLLTGPEIAIDHSWESAMVGNSTFQLFSFTYNNTVVSLAK